MIFFSSQTQFFSKELAIAKPAKYIWTTSEINLAVLLSMQNFPLRTWQEHWLVNNLAQYYPHNRSFNLPVQLYFKITVFFSCSLDLKPTNLEIRYWIQTTKSLTLQICRSAYFPRCKKQLKQVGMFSISYECKNVFVLARFITPFISIWFLLLQWSK